MRAPLLVFAIVAGFSLTGGGVWAQEPAPFPEFEAKRVKPPKPGAKKRITIQIEEATPAEAAAPTDVPVTGETNTIGRYAWFWDEIPAELPDAPGASRLYDALDAISRDNTVAAPSLQVLLDIAQTQGISILTSTVGTDVSPALVLAVIAVESAGKADAVSSAGAQGLMQLMPATASRFGVSDSLNAGENIAGGVKYLDWLMNRFNQDPILVLAGYNAGEGSVQTHQGVPPFAETRDYVPKVLAAFKVARSLCATPPDLMSDGCVFTVMN